MSRPIPVADVGAKKKPHITTVFARLRLFTSGCVLWWVRPHFIWLLPLGSPVVSGFHGTKSTTLLPRLAVADCHGATWSANSNTVRMPCRAYSRVSAGAIAIALTFILSLPFRAHIDLASDPVETAFTAPLLLVGAPHIIGNETTLGCKATHTTGIGTRAPAHGVRAGRALLRTELRWLTELRGANH